MSPFIGGTMQVNLREMISRVCYDDKLLHLPSCLRDTCALRSFCKAMTFPPYTCLPDRFDRRMGYLPACRFVRRPPEKRRVLPIIRGWRSLNQNRLIFMYLLKLTSILFFYDLVRFLSSYIFLDRKWCRGSPVSWGQGLQKRPPPPPPPPRPP